MQTIIIKNVPDDIFKIYWREINFSNDFFLWIDFKELEENEITEEIEHSIEEAKKIPKKFLQNI